MTLRDHFHPPLSVRRHWHAFHNSWATYLSSDLNRRLPEGYFAEANVQFGIEIDVATYKENGSHALPQPVGDADWVPPAAAQTIALALATDQIEVLVFDVKEGPVLAGAVELVSPANKDRPAHRDAFLAKCMAYVQQGIGLAVVDVVTQRAAHLHDELLARLDPTGATPLKADLYAAAYRPVDQGGVTRLEVWQEPLAIGAPLPILPLWLRGGLCLRLDLNGTYARTCEEQRVPAFDS